MPRRPSLDLESVLAGEARSQRGQLREVEDRRKALVSEWSQEPWAFLTGKDLDGRPVVWTKDEDDPKAPIKAFPGHLEYLRRFVTLLHCQGDPRAFPTYRTRPGYEWLEGLAIALRVVLKLDLDADPFYNRPLFIDKARQMYVSTAILLFGLWDCGFHQARLWLISKTKEDQSAQLLRDKVRFPFRQMPQWLQSVVSLKPRPEIRVPFTRTNSTMLGVSQNVAASEARGNTASRVLVDEAAVLDLLPDILAAVLPMCPRMILPSTPNLSAGGPTFVKYLESA